MRFVIVSLINGDAHIFHEKMIEQLTSQFKVKRQKLQSHFTIKAPFETEDKNLVRQIEDLTDVFCRNHEAIPYKIDNYGHFRDSVVFMDIEANNKMHETCKEYMEELKRLEGLEWKPNENKSKVFHCTLISKIYPDKYNAVWTYVNNNPCSFDCSFDNISMMLWDGQKWVLHKSFSLK